MFETPTNARHRDAIRAAHSARSKAFADILNFFRPGK
ncbi:hypothetical protein SAMN05443551_2804 [Marivita hallyeonensis]|uniref:Uncharacterized protein n=1 Tax=Marivita hallyeonensis TaxID=996342 RepID=A0A1M5UUD6_9RHOB|nr:hypothetical protein SAMN05443551_2804 [Marivita hallyeonensis]